MGWFRYYPEVRNDVKLRRAARETKRTLCEAIGAWSVILCLASDSPIPGMLALTESEPLTLGDIADAMGLPDKVAMQFMDFFVSAEMLSVEDGVWSLVHWGSRQFTGDNSAERVRRFRERKKKAVETLPETDGNDECNVTEPLHVTANETNVTPLKRDNEVTVTPPEYRVQSTDITTSQVVQDSTLLESTTTHAHMHEEIVTQPQESASESTYRLCSLYGSLNKPRVAREEDCEIEDMLRERPDWDELKAIRAMEKCHTSAIESKGKGWRATSLRYYEGAIIDALEGKEPGRNGGKSGGRNKPIRI